MFLECILEDVKEKTLIYKCKKRIVPKETFLWEKQDRKIRINFCNSNLNNYSYIYGEDVVTAFFPCFFPNFLMRYFLKKELNSKIKVKNPDYKVEIIIID